ARLLGFKLRTSQANGDSAAPSGPEPQAAPWSPCKVGCLPLCTAHGDPDEQDMQQEWMELCRCVPFDLPEVGGPEAARELWALLGNSLNPQVVALVCQACELSECLQGPAAASPR
ncbi:unnamed protein product, partial [Polarella glacialis]